MTKKRILILGSTGSIGTQVLECLRFLEDYYEVIGLTCYSSKELFERQKREWAPRFTSVLSLEKKPEKTLAELIQKSDIEYVVNAVSGVAGVLPTLIAARAGKKIFLANKESLVMNGQEVVSTAVESEARIIPLDSEAAGLWQLLRCTHDKHAAHVVQSVCSAVPSLCSEKISTVKEFYITASGGPFFGFSHNQLARVTREDALNHPTWKMGKKITVDSATLMNKAFELIECSVLFGIDHKKIKVVVDRTSTAHAGVVYSDDREEWVTYAPDMRTPILDALLFEIGKKDFSVDSIQLPRITNSMNKGRFQEVDSAVFPALERAHRALSGGQPECKKLCEENEVRVRAFLNNTILFTDLLSL